jgi:hypothetical protein
MTHHAISIKRPWPWAIMFLPPEISKDCENRTWDLPNFVRGEWLWLHSGKIADDVFAWGFIERVSGRRPPDSERGKRETGEIVGCIKFGHEVLVPGTWALSKWYVGNYGWPIVDACPLREPVPCVGQRGFWVPPEMDGLRMAELAYRPDLSEPRP